MKKKIDKLIKIETINFPSVFGLLDLILYETTYHKQPEMRFIIVIKTKKIPTVPLIRIHSSCLYSEVFGYLGCDCQDQLKKSLKLISKIGGVLFYLDQEGRGHGLIKKTKELKIQEKGLDTVEASKKLNLIPDNRFYDAVVDILKEMGIDKIKIITNNPLKIKDIAKNNIKIIKRVSLKSKVNKFNINYLKTKKEKLNHLIDF